MPFTPYHLGPVIFALGLYQVKRPSRKQLALAGSAMATGAVIPDLQGFYSVFFDHSVPLHGFSHTLVGAVTYCFVLWILLFLMRLLNTKVPSPEQFSLTVLVSIVVFHLIPDVVLWSDMQILWPLSSWSPGEPERYSTVVTVLSLVGFVGILLLIVVPLLQTHAQESDILAN